jgi:hypothetical protein
VRCEGKTTDEPLPTSSRILCTYRGIFYFPKQSNNSNKRKEIHTAISPPERPSSPRDCLLCLDVGGEIKTEGFLNSRRPRENVNNVLVDVNGAAARSDDDGRGIPPAEGR